MKLAEETLGRYDALMQELSDPNIFSDQRRYAGIAKEHARMREIESEVATLEHAVAEEEVALEIAKDKKRCMVAGCEGVLTSRSIWMNSGGAFSVMSTRTTKIT